MPQRRVRRHLGAPNWAVVLLLAVLHAGSAASAAPPRPVLSTSRLQFIRQALPQADHAAVQHIAAEHLSPADRNNATLLRVFDRQKRLIGYVRDFIGPVSPNQACPCNPLNLSLVFGADLRLLTVLAPAPLQKWGHEAMTPAEHARLVELMQQLPLALCEVPTVEDMVDAQSGATRQALAEVVVHHAALTTRRVAGLVADTRAILQRRPVDRRRRALLHWVDSDAPPARRALELARLVEELQDQGLRLQAFGQMVRAYVAALQRGQEALPAVERTILNFAVLCEGGGQEVTTACLKIAETRRRQPFVARCAEHLVAARARGIAPFTREYLLGTAHFMNNRFDEALPLLLQAAETRPVREAALLHLRLAKAQLIVGQPQAARKTLMALLEEHPLIPDGVLTLQATGIADWQITWQVIEAASRAAFLRQEIDLDGLPEAAPLRLPGGRECQVPYAQPQQVTVAMFFATWCPHCQAELPRVREFVAATAPQQVRLLAVRTAMEKETPDARQFWRRFAADFVVYHDADMSHAFTESARATGRPTMLPTLAVIDARRHVRFFIEPGLYRDVTAELRWATAAAAAPAR